MERSLRIFGFENKGSSYNCFINSVLHVYFRISEAKTFFREMVKNTNHSLNSINALKRVIQKTRQKNECENISLVELRQALSSEYPMTFVQTQGGDPTQVVQFLLNSVDNLVNLQQLSIFSTAFTEEAEMITEQFERTFLTIPMHRVIPCLESRGEIPENLNVPKLYKVFNMNFSQNVESKLKRLINSGDNVDHDMAFKLSARPPRIIMFNFEYKSYFDNVNTNGTDMHQAPFTQRNKLSSVLVQEFELQDIFEAPEVDSDDSDDDMSDDEDNIDSSQYFCQLTSVLAYYGGHYMSYILHHNQWYECNDTIVKPISNASTLQQYFQQNKLIPFLAFYKVINKSEDAQSCSEQSSSITPPESPPSKHSQSGCEKFSDPSPNYNLQIEECKSSNHGSNHGSNEAKSPEKVIKSAVKSFETLDSSLLLTKSVNERVSCFHYGFSEKSYPCTSEDEDSEMDEDEPDTLPKGTKELLHSAKR